ncbi:Hsp20/alpha crystallin family protein [Ottowia oryzae]|uniref:Molecular chaperone n=1 Tax=Ottowia oryzae TaxID=2109914 RepID=A0A2S0MEW7_9BURK|nr:Hsp20/alpha crystallin family protein [Ottowia oryzae]AVO34418.1 molecular chaperone [Ottowia oryzae]
MIFTSANPNLRRSVYGPALRSLDRFLDDAVAVAKNAGTQLKEEEKHWELSIDVPGVSRDQLNIAIEGATVRVTTVEGAPREYRKAYEFAQEVDTAASHAKLENGVLTLTLAKLVPQSKATNLNID